MAAGPVDGHGAAPPRGARGREASEAATVHARAPLHRIGVRTGEGGDRARLEGLHADRLEPLRAGVSAP